MRTRTLALLLTTASTGLAIAQSKLPPDIDSKSFTRLPLIDRASLDDEGKKIWDYVGGARGMPATGPAPLTMYSPKAAKPIHELNQYLRTTVVGPRYFELSALIAAREFDQQYEWSAHEPAAVRAGAEQSVVDAIKFNRGLNGVPEKDAALIRLGRAIFRDHKVSSEVWAQMERLFGRQGAVELTMVMADYAMAGFILTAVDQQLPPDRKPLLPAR